MALSNWDTCAFDKSGKPCNGILSKKFKDGSIASVCFYKNWLYVSDDRMWADGRSYVTPTIAEVQEGNISVASFRIHATRGPQQSILAFIETGYQHSKDPEYAYDCMCGIGCYGFDSTKWVGIKPATLTELHNYLALLKEEYGLPKGYLERITKTEALRFNQGDGFFAEHFESPNINTATKIGEAQEPVLLQMFK